MLKKNWVLVIVSLFLGGLVTEIIHVSTGDPNRPRTTNLSLLYGIIIFVVLKVMIKISDRDVTK
jgi:hypothetical protein